MDAGKRNRRVTRAVPQANQDNPSEAERIARTDCPSGISPSSTIARRPVRFGPIKKRLALAFSFYTTQRRLVFSGIPCRTILIDGDTGSFRSISPRKTTDSIVRLAWPILTDSFYQS
jgi:hypothetical protein